MCNFLGLMLGIGIGALWVEMAEPKKRWRYNVIRHALSILGFVFGGAILIYSWDDSQWWEKALAIVWCLTMSRYAYEWDKRKDIESGVECE